MNGFGALLDARVALEDLLSRRCIAMVVQGAQEDTQSSLLCIPTDSDAV